MTQPVIVWCAIAALLLCTFIVRNIALRYNRKHADAQRTSHALHALELGTEREMFFVPGDPAANGCDEALNDE